MKSNYTTTITNEARRRGIKVNVIDADTPIFELCLKGKKVRCYNSLTDRVGAVTFHLTQNKHLANRFLHRHGFPVPDQILYSSFSVALEFLERCRQVVVKPCSQWGARGVSTHITTADELRPAVRMARRYESEVILEECVGGVDQRLIFVDSRFVSAIQRNPAAVTGNGKSSIRTLIHAKNKAAATAEPANRIPLDRETLRCLQSRGLDYTSVPDAGRRIIVRRTSNFHTGGTVDVITESVGSDLKKLAKKIVRLTGLPVVGIDFLVDEKSGTYNVIEIAPDLAISPRGGDVVARHFIDYLFPETVSGL